MHQFIYCTIIINYFVRYPKTPEEAMLTRFLRTIKEKAGTKWNHEIFEEVRHYLVEQDSNIYVYAEDLPQDVRWQIINFPDNKIENISESIKVAWLGNDFLTSLKYAVIHQLGKYEEYTSAGNEDHWSKLTKDVNSKRYGPIGNSTQYIQAIQAFSDALRFNYILFYEDGKIHTNMPNKHNYKETIFLLINKERNLFGSVIDIIANPLPKASSE